MTVRLIVFFVIALAAQLNAADNALEPFASVVRQGDMIVATLPATGSRYLVDVAPQPRATAYGESFQLRDGASLSLDHKHGGYRITCRLSPVAGLQVESEFDAHSFGGGISKRSYFIKAQ